MDSAKYGRWIVPFKKFGMVRVNIIVIPTSYSFKYYQVLFVSVIKKLSVGN